MNSLIQRLFIASTCLIGLASCGGGNDLTSGSSAGVTSASAVTAGTSNSATTTSVTATKAAMDKVGNSFATVPAGSMLRVAYIDATASGGLAAIPATGYSTPDILIYAFVQSGLTSPTLDSYLVSAITNGASQQGAGKQTFISLGGQFGASISLANVPSIVSNVSAGIKALNATLPKANQVVGVDLDLEQSQDSATIAALAAGFKQAGFLVSIAPQPVTLSGPDGTVDPNNPSNLGLSAGGFNNQFGQAIASGNVDYIFAQAYNTGNFTVGGCNENQLCFIGQLATALNNAQKASCSGSSGTPLCIPSKTKYAIGLPSSRAGVGENHASIWQPASGAYDGAAGLSALATSINAALPILQKNNNNGIMVWSQDTDYLPTGYGDQYACIGGFNSVIFGSTLAMTCPGAPPPPSPLPAFTMVITNTGSTYASVILQTSAWQYDYVGGPSNLAIAPGATVTVGTSAVSPPVPVSKGLDAFFDPQGAPATAERIAIGNYASALDVTANNPLNGSGGTVCLGPPAGTFTAGQTATISLNGQTGKCSLNLSTK